MDPRAGGMRRFMRSMNRDQSVKQEKIKKGTYKRILTFAAPYKKFLTIFLMVIILDAIIGVVNPLIYKSIIDNGIIAKNTDLIIKLAVLVAVLAIGDAGLSFIQRYFSARIGEGLIFDMRTKVFSHIQQMPVAFFTRTQTGALVSRLNNDVLGAQEAFTDLLSTVIGNVISVTLIIIAMLFLSWQLTLVSLLLLPLFLFPARWFGGHLAAIARESYALNAEMNTTMVERFNVAGAMLAKLFGNPKNEDKLFAEKAGRVRDIGVSQAMYTRIFFISLTITASFATAIVYGWGGVLAVQKILDVGTVVALTAYLNRLYQPLTALSNIQVDVLTALVSFERVFEVLDLPPMIAERPHAKKIPRGPATLTFSHVAFRYPTAEEVSLASLESVATLDRTKAQEVLFDISFTVKAGQMTALVGPTGAGKTTIIGLAARLYDARAGSVAINGIDVRDATLDSLHQTIGMVTQDPHMFHDTIRANLLYAKPDATDTEIMNAITGAQILPLMQKLPQGLDTMVGERGYRLSGGEKQQLAIARLLLKAPDIVILDEATAHLDSESERKVQLALQTALKNRTSLVIAHRLSTILNADQILVINHGRIVEKGKHEELISQKGLYAELFKTQFRAKISEKK
jgi:ATP-binding cassette, subfamily B, bacterial